MHLSTSEGVSINIIQESANFYHRIGTTLQLLNDTRGNRVDTIEDYVRGERETIITEIYSYKKWMNEDPNYSWTGLTDCFRACGLNCLALTLSSILEFLHPHQNRFNKVKLATVILCCQSQCMEFIAVAAHNSQQQNCFINLTMCTTTNKYGHHMQSLCTLIDIIINLFYRCHLYSERVTSVRGSENAATRTPTSYMCNNN